MNDTSSRCAGPGSACRLLQLEAPGARPVWAVLDAAGMRRFTGELTLSSRPAVRVYFNDGEVYYAERDGDPSISDRLVEYGVVTTDELVAGTVQLGAVAHLGRLFDRVPSLERDPVELVLEVITGEVLGEIADHTVDQVAIASYRHHPSGVSKWRHRPAAAHGAYDAPLTGQVPIISDALSASPESSIHPRAEFIAESDPQPTADDYQMVADYEQLMASAALAPVTDEEAPTLHVSVPEPVFAAPVVDEFIVVELVTEVEIEPVVELEPVAEVELVVEPAEPAVVQPFSFEFDLNKVLAQVALENDGLPISTDADAGDIDEDVRNAVREALAEITAATRPPVSDGLSPTAFEIALQSAPETAADIEPADAQRPWLAGYVSPALAHATGQADDDNDDHAEDGVTHEGGVVAINEPAETAETGATEADAAVPALPPASLRRLIGGGRKP
jgi:hypothetical protein